MSRWDRLLPGPMMTSPPLFQSQTSMILATLHDRTRHELLTVDLMRMLFVVEDSEGGGCVLHMRDGGYVIAVQESREKVVSLLTGDRERGRS